MKGEKSGLASQQLEASRIPAWSIPPTLSQAAAIHNHQLIHVPDPSPPCISYYPGHEDKAVQESSSLPAPALLMGKEGKTAIAGRPGRLGKGRHTVGALLSWLSISTGGRSLPNEPSGSVSAGQRHRARLQAGRCLLRKLVNQLFRQAPYPLPC